eukprot:gnl/MRDRNA2_/MRDRNA2_86322_c0_seq1.p1 gnl/MRDRNA2_/MRDRNA2_86322_c0~~gnl/MRDRNA2_/MRDRNA2_86322_c0_seq1.p1  ORF type:complete len:723 (+),score=284.93 gnl/MRDRNA2_/MRDRNA2_86322_c0_seq1:60-2171(+)
MATSKATMVMAFFFLFVANAHGIQQKVTPVEKVIELLTKLEEEVTAEGKKEAAAYDKFACFAKEQADDKFYAINKSKKKIEMQQAQIKALAAEITDLNQQISDHKKEVRKLKEEQEDADTVRSEQYEKYATKERSLSAAIKMVEGAIAALSQSKEGMTDAKLDLQQVLSRPVVRDALALIQQEPAAYTYGSNDIIAVLEGLLKTFKENKVELDTDEAHKRNDYELEKQARENTIKFTMQTIDEKAKLAAEKESEKEAITKDMNEEIADMEADEAFLKELTELGETKAKEFDQRSKTRAAEITALNEALKILKEGVQPNYAANKKLNLVTQKLNLVTPKKTVQEGAPVAKSAHGHWVWVEDPVTSQATAFLQIRELASESKPQKFLKFLTQKAQVLKSNTLSTLLMKIQVTAGIDHFVKVRGMIKDLIAKLEADAEAEATQKGFCDKAMEKATTARDEAKAGIEEQTAIIDKKKSEIADLTAEIDELSNQIAELRKGLFEAEQLRAAEKADNEKTLEMANEGKDNIEAAIKVLKEFYGEAGFVQTGFVPAGADRDGNTVTDLAPDTGFDGKYGGNQKAAEGIFGFLEVILSDFKRTIEETEAAEEEAAEAHAQYKEDTEADIETKSADKKEKEELKETTEGELVEAQDSLKAFETDLKDAKKELEVLKPLCVDTGASWKDRRAKAKQEVEALKEALAILEDWQK